MEKIYSKINPSKLLHIIQRLDKIKEPRVDLIRRNILYNALL